MAKSAKKPAKSQLVKSPKGGAAHSAKATKSKTQGVKKPKTPRAKAGASGTSASAGRSPADVPPSYSGSAEAYAAHRERMAGVARKASATTRDVGVIPDIGNIERRDGCRGSLKLFIETYSPEALYFRWSPDHLRAIERIEEAATRGALYAFAMARGSGKTLLCRMATLWVMSYAHCRYPYLVGSTEEKARESLDTLQTIIRFNPQYGEDFPEIAVPARHLQGIANRSAGQVCCGESTLIEWSADHLVLPTVPPPANWPADWPLRSDGKVPTSGLLVSVSGLTGEGIRGALRTLSNGEMLRPDFVLLDDPQTAVSARKRTQNANRLKLVSADLLGLAGPGKSMSAVMPCTVIEPGDMVDQLLDRTKHPAWRGERSGMLRTMPKNMQAWEDGYRDVLNADSLREPPDYTASNNYYVENRATLDEGAEASWEDRKLPTEVSAIQHAMHLYLRDRRAFMSEYQNNPLPPEELGQLPDLDADDIADRLTHIPRGVVPPYCSRLTAGVDVQGQIVYWVVCAWGENFSGAVIDYGTFPKQTRSYFAASDPRPAMSDRWPNHNEQSRVYAGVKETVTQILGRRHSGASGGDAMVSMALVDSGKWTKEVATACRQIPEAYARCVFPSKGWGSTTRPMNTWEREVDELPPGDNWRNRRNKDAGIGRLILVEVNHWKSFVARALQTPEMGPGCLQLFGSNPDEHRLFADHLTAEVRTVPFRRTTGDQREVEVWQMRSGRPDNHWWDALVLATVAASVLGVKWDAAAASGNPVSPRTPKKRPPTLAERMAKCGEPKRIGGDILDPR